MPETQPDPRGETYNSITLRGRILAQPVPFGTGDGRGVSFRLATLTSVHQGGGVFGEVEQEHEVVAWHRPAGLAAVAEKLHTGQVVMVLGALVYRRHAGTTFPQIKARQIFP